MTRAKRTAAAIEPAAAEPAAEHEHRYTIIVGHAPITMAAGVLLDDRRECRCGASISVGSYRYDPPG